MNSNSNEGSYRLNDAAMLDRERTRLPQQAELLVDFEFPTLVEHGLVRGSRVLDLGCGDGSFVAALSRRLAQCTWFGIDRNKALLEDAKWRSPSLSTLCGDVTNPQTIRSALREWRPDVVLCRFLFQHLTLIASTSMLEAIFAELNWPATVIIVDVDDSTVSTTPSCPELIELVKHAGKLQSGAGGNRYRGKGLMASLNSVGFAGCAETCVEIRSSQTGLHRWWTTLGPIWTGRGTKNEQPLSSLACRVDNWVRLAESHGFEAVLGVYIASGHSHP
jgi:SAM-dependent methyltransferase